MALHLYRQTHTRDWVAKVGVAITGEPAKAPDSVTSIPDVN